MYRRDTYDFYDLEDSEMENEVLKPEEVMNYLCVGRNSFYKLVNSGALPAFRIGKLWRVSREALEKFCISRCEIE